MLASGGVSLGNLLVAAFCTALGGIWVFRVLPSLWRGEGFAANLFTYEYPPKWWLWGNALWHAYARTAVFGTTLFAVLTPMLLIDYLAPDSFRNSALFSGIFVTTLFLWLVGSISIALLNQPSFLVPRRMRDDPGLVGELWRASRERRRTHGSSGDSN